MKAETIIKHIQESQLTGDEIRKIWAVLKEKSNANRQIAVFDFPAGSYVKFLDKHGNVLHGLVMKRNRKTLTVSASDGRTWRVAPDLLTESTQEEYEDAKQRESDLMKFGAIALRPRPRPR
jgi:hypothetical protein